jgi:hypothetical protein
MTEEYSSNGFFDIYCTQCTAGQNCTTFHLLSSVGNPNLGLGLGAILIDLSKLGERVITWGEPQTLLTPLAVATLSCTNVETGAKV